MKRTYLLMLLALVASFCISCTREEPQEEPQEEPELNILNETGKIEVGPEATTQSLQFSTNVDWTAQESADWLELSQRKGKAGEQEISLKISENPDYESRSGNVVITAKDKTVKYIIEQSEKKGFTLDETSYSIGSEGGTLSIPVKANASYKLEVAPECASWLSVSGTKTLIEHMETITVAPNENYEERTGKIKIVYENEEAVITIRQSQKDELIIGKKEYEISEKGGKIDVLIETNTEFTSTVLGDATSWISIEQTRAEELETKKLILNISSNGTYDARTGQIKVSGAGKESYITVIQVQNDALIIEKDTYEIGSDGGTISIPVKANISYKMEVAPECASWLSIGGTKALIEHMETVTVAPNKNYEERTGKVKIIYDDEEVVITIRQSQKDELIIEKDTYEISEEGGKINVLIETNTEFTSTVLDNGKGWISIEKTRTPGLEEHQLTLNIAKNEDETTRIGQIKISGAGKESIITIIQEQPIILKVDKTEVEVGSEGGSFNLDIESNCAFAIIIKEEDSSWLKFKEDLKSASMNDVPSNLTDTLHLKFTVAKNETYEERTGTITVKSYETPKEISYTITVHQTANQDILVKNETIHVDYKSQTITIPIQSNVEFSTSLTNQNWLEKISTRGLTDHEIKLSCTENTGKTSREATLTLKSADLQKEIRIIQATKPIQEKVDLGLSVQWGSFNLGASAPEEVGKYYAWGELNGYAPYENHDFKWHNYLKSEGASMNSSKDAGTSADPLQKFVYPNQLNLDLAHDAAHQELGELWRMPTKAEIDELFSMCKVEEATLNQVQGYLFTSSVNGKTIFIPAAGAIDGNTHIYSNNAICWSSSPGKNDAQTALYMQETLLSQGNYRYFGIPIRPVYGAEKHLPKISLGDIMVLEDHVCIEGKISDDGGGKIIEKGLLYSTSPNPDVHNSTIVNLTEDLYQFKHDIYEFEPETQYYVKAYARNEVGIAYSDIRSFKTPMASFLEISTEAELRAFAEMVDTTSKPLYARLVADIQLTKYWIAMGDEKNPFRGVFDGNHHRIAKLSPRGSNSGLFGVIENATIQNLSVDGIFESGTNIGGIAGKALNSTIDNCQSDLYSSIGGTVGGIVGYAYFSVIKNCSHSDQAIGHTDASYIGGIVGKSELTDIYNCYNQGDIYGDEYYGGIVGYLDGGSSVINCFNTGNFPNMKFSDQAGGITGYNRGRIYNCYNAGTMTAKRVSGDQNSTNCGGVAGYNEFNSKCYYSYFLMQAPTNVDFKYAGDVNNGYTDKCGSFNKAGEFTDKNLSYNGDTIHLSVSLNQWVDANNSEKLYKSWIVKEGWPEFQN